MNCSYVPRRPDSRSKPPESPELSKTAQDRIDHLEQVVLGLLKGQSKASAQVATPVSNVDTYTTDGVSSIPAVEDAMISLMENGRDEISSPRLSNRAMNMSAENSQRFTVDTARWASLLHEIDSVRSLLSEKDKQSDLHNQRDCQLPQPFSDAPGPRLLFGSARSMTRSDLLSHLPSKYSCDPLVNRFFDHLYPAMHILHEPMFRKQYERFWHDRSSTSIVWVAQLFAILRVAMLDYLRENDEPVEYKGKCADFATNFRNYFTECLILADYLQPHEFVIDALCLHLYGEYVCTRDAQSSLWVLIGLIARLAMRLGYHQAAQPLLSSSPFQVEMRRRTWAFIRQFEILISFQVGMPSMIGTRSFNNPLPRNLHDDNDTFTEDCSVLPTALPKSEPAPISYLIAKTKMAYGFAHAVDELNRNEDVPYQRILEIDRDLRRLYNDVPDYYKLGQLSEQGSLVVTAARFVLSSIHHRSLIVMHSRYLHIAKTDTRYRYSRCVCLSSAMTILRYQAIQNQKIPVEDRHRSLTNYQTSFAIHDYLLAATVISTELCSTSAKDSSASSKVLSGEPPRAEMLRALDHSARIFDEMKSQSTEAREAGEILRLLVNKLENDTRNAQRIPQGTRHNEISQSPLGPQQCDRVSRPCPTDWPMSSSEYSRTTPASNTQARASWENVMSEEQQRFLGGSLHVHDSRLSDRPSSILPRQSIIGRDGQGSSSVWPVSQKGDPSTQSSLRSRPSTRVDSQPDWTMPDYLESSWAMSFPDLQNDLTPATEIAEQSVFSSGVGCYGSPENANPLSYHSAASTLSNPVSALWGLNSAF